MSAEISDIQLMPLYPRNSNITLDNVLDSDLESVSFQGIKDISLISTVKVSLSDNISPFIPLWFSNIWIEKSTYISIMFAYLTEDMLSYYQFLSYLEIEFFNKFVLFASCCEETQQPRQLIKQSTQLGVHASRKQQGS